MTATAGMIATNVTSMNSFKDFLIVANQSGAGMLFSAIDFLVFMILFITLAGQFGWQSAFLSAGFIGLVLSILFLYMGVIPFFVCGIFVASIIIIGLIIVLSNKYD
jgi:hypothetical protein